MTRSSLLLTVAPLCLAAAPHLAWAQDPTFDLRTCTARAVVDGIAADDFLAVRSGPGTSYAQLGETHRGDVVAICGGHGDWAQIIAPSGQPGWSYATGNLTRIADAAPGVALPQTVGSPARAGSNLEGLAATATCVARARVDGIAPNDFLAVRAGPGTTYQQVGEVHWGDVVAVCGGRGDWAQVVTATGIAGWSYATGNLTAVATAPTTIPTRPVEGTPQEAAPSDGLSTGQMVGLAAIGVFVLCGLFCPDGSETYDDGYDADAGSGGDDWDYRSSPETGSGSDAPGGVMSPPQIEVAPINPFYGSDHGVGD